MKIKRKSVPKKQTIRSLKKRVWRTFSRYIRLRDCLFTTGTLTHGKCITCEADLPIGELQAGHFISGRHNAYLFSEEGVHAQCEGCNKWGGGKPLIYRRKIVELYGDGYDEVLEKEAQHTKQFTIVELKELEKNLKEKIIKMGGD